MKTIWFKRAGWGYVPVHPAGLVITLAAIICMVPMWIAVNKSNSEISDAMIEMFIYVSCVGFWWKWVAEKTSTRK